MKSYKNPVFLYVLTTGDEYFKVHPHYNIPLDYDEIFAISLMTIGGEEEIIHLNNELYKPRRKQLDELVRYHTGYTNEMLADAPTFSRKDKDYIQKVIDEAEALVSFDTLKYYFFLKNEGIIIDDKKLIDLNTPEDNGGNLFVSYEDLCDYWGVPCQKYEYDPLNLKPINTGIRCHIMERVYDCICKQEKYQAPPVIPPLTENVPDDEGMPF